MIEEIDASLETLMEQGSLTAAVYLADAVKQLDDKMGEGFAKRNPSLLGLFMLTSAIDCAGVTLAQQIRHGLEAIRTMQCDFPSVVKELRNLVGSVLDVESAIYATRAT